MNTRLLFYSIIELKAITILNSSPSCGGAECKTQPGNKTNLPATNLDVKVVSHQLDENLSMYPETGLIQLFPISEFPSFT